MGRPPDPLDALWAWSITSARVGHRRIVVMARSPDNLGVPIVSLQGLRRLDDRTPGGTYARPQASN